MVLGGGVWILGSQRNLNSVNLRETSDVCGLAFWTRVEAFVHLLGVDTHTLAISSCQNDSTEHSWEERGVHHEQSPPCSDHRGTSGKCLGSKSLEPLLYFC